MELKRQVFCYKNYEEDNTQWWSAGCFYDARKRRDGNWDIRTNLGNVGSVGPNYLLSYFNEYFVEISHLEIEQQESIRAAVAALNIRVKFSARFDELLCSQKFAEFSWRNNQGETVSITEDYARLEELPSLLDSLAEDSRYESQRVKALRDAVAAGLNGVVSEKESAKSQKAEPPSNPPRELRVRTEDGELVASPYDDGVCVGIEVRFFKNGAEGGVLLFAVENDPKEVTTTAYLFEPDKDEVTASVQLR